MKLSAAALKNVDYKKVAIEHGEKFVVGLVAICALIALLKSNWIPYDRAPEEMVTTTAETEDTIRDNSWSEAELAKYQVQDPIVERVAAILKPSAKNRYEYNEPMIWRPGERKEKVGEPQWLAVESPLVDSGSFIIEIPNDSALTPAKAAESDQLASNDASEGKGTGGGAAGDGEIDDSDIPDEFKTRRAVKGRGPKRERRASAMVKFGRGRFEREATKQEREKYREEKRKRGGRGSRGREEENERRTARTNVDGKGVRYVSFRGMIPFRRQLEAVAKAYSSPTVTPSIELRVVLNDFELQRQTMLPNLTWSDWETVDTQIAKDMLYESGDIDLEVVDAGVTDPTVTMPLPRRARGLWGDMATHPDIKHYELTPEQMELELRLNEKLLEEHQKKQEQKTEELQPGGFNDSQFDVRNIRKRMRGTNAAKSIMDELLSEDLSKQDRKDKLIADIKQRINAEGNLILFRYFDFDVDPGNAYRYRARVVYKNPSSELGLEQVKTPEVTDGLTRSTPWSEASQAVFVPLDHNVFLADVITQSGRSPAGALLDVYQWYPDTGTTIHEEKMKVSVGNLIGGEHETPLLNPAQNLFEETKVNFNTGELLVDVSGNPRIKRDDHPDLNLKNLSGGRLPTYGRVLVVDRSGDLRTLDPLSDQEEQARKARRLQFERGPYEEILNWEKENAKIEAEGKLDRRSRKYEQPDNSRDRNRRGRGRNR
jgi:hypothetical protein